MAFVPAPNVIQLEARYTLNGAQIENVLYIRRGSNLFLDAVALSATIFLSTFWAAYRTHATNQLSLRELYYTDLTSQFSDTATITETLPQTGTVNTDAVPNGSALVICFRSGGRGRGSRGRNYLAGIGEGLVVNSSYQATPVNEIISGYEGFQLGLQGEGMAHCVVSRVLNGDDRPVAQVRDITEYTATTLGVRSQRRRNLGIGT